MIDIFKSTDSQYIYIDTVIGQISEDFLFFKNSSDQFTIKGRNSNIPLAVRLTYDKVRGKDIQGNFITFRNPQELEDYFNNIFTYSPQTNTGGGGTVGGVSIAQFNILNNRLDQHINNKDNPHVTKGDNIPEGTDLITIFNTGLI